MKHVRLSLVVLALVSAACADAVGPETLSRGQDPSAPHFTRPGGPLLNGGWVGSGVSDSTSTDSTSTDSTTT